MVIERSMGLASGENGVKSILKTRYAEATVVANSLTDAVECTGVDRKNTVIVLDGNVLLMQVPQQAASFAAYIGTISSAIRSGMANAALVIVVFDEPQCLTQAKAEEQRRRDTARTKTTPLCSVDISPHPTTDAYGMKELFAAADCHAIVRCRPARQRFFDQVGQEVMMNLKRNIDNWKGQGHETVLLFDGLDPLGAARPEGQERKPQIFGSDAGVAALFQREEAIGEGDLKLLWAQRRVESLVEQGKLDVALHITNTIDTDSLAIHLLDEAKRTGASNPEKSVKGMLAFRERAVKRSIDDDDARATYWCVDVCMLHQLVQNDLWAVAKKEPTPIEARCAMALLAAGFSMAGCDFLKQPGLTARMVFDAVPGMLKASPDLVELMKNCYGEDRDDAKKVQPALRRLLLICAGNMEQKKGTRKASIASVRNHETDVLLRAAFVTSYWCGVEHRGSLVDFGFSAAPATSADLVPKLPVPQLMPWEPPPKVVSRFFASAARSQDRVEDVIEA